MSIPNPYHKGELAVQRRANATEMARRSGSAVNTAIPARALRFIEQQPMAVIGSIDAEGRIWASVLTGQPGFLRAVDKNTLEIDLSRPRSSKNDPLWRNLEENPAVGLLVIELGTRRRLRINGRARRGSAERSLIDVERAYPNCPKYIQRREWKIPASQEELDTLPGTQGTKLNAAQKRLIADADTLFIASAHPDQGVDASHRGGPSGFVQIVNDRQLRIPDYAGNSMFNTLGNFVCYPYGGVAFINFKRGNLLQLTGRVKILWDLDDVNHETGGTRRYWQMDISEWRESRLPFRLEWEYRDASPFLSQQHRKTDHGEFTPVIDTRTDSAGIQAHQKPSLRRPQS